MKTLNSILTKRCISGGKILGRIGSLFLVLFSLSSSFSQSVAQRPFISTWNTSPDPYTQTSHIIFPGIGQNYTIFWTGRVGGRTVYGELLGNNATRINFPAPGTYQVRVGPGNGVFHRIQMLASEAVKLVSVDQWGSVQWSSMANAFASCSNMNVLATDVPDLSNVTDMSSMFSYCRRLTGNPTFNSWNTGNVRNMSMLFYFAHAFNQPIGNWNTGNVTSMSSTFYGAYAFNQPIGNWNTGNVNLMTYMFAQARIFNQPIGNWNTSKVTSMTGLFYHAYAFNQPIGNWNTRNVIFMDGMFGFNPVFNQPIGNWNTQNVINMSVMFSSATAFNQAIGNWNLTKVLNTDYMFYNAYAFNQPLSNWNTSAVTTMIGMFGYAYAFNQSLGSWNVNKVAKMNAMLDYCGLSTDNYDATLNGWYSRSVQKSVTLGAASLTYCKGSGRRDMYKRFSRWLIFGDIYDCSDCTECRENAEQVAAVNKPKIDAETGPDFAYPNPVSDRLFLKEQGSGIQAFMLTDLTGRVVLKKEEKISSPLQKEISVSDFASGIYILTLRDRDGKTQTQQIVVKK